MNGGSQPAVVARTEVAVEARSALLLVDVQNDFCPGGALAVPGGDRVVEALNRYIKAAIAEGAPIYASRECHPPITTHFTSQGGQWPVHCVRETKGAEFHPALELPRQATIITKGDSADKPGYSAFEGHTADATPLLADLQKRHIDHLYVGGLATDYCVKHSVLDALKEGLQVTVLEDAIAGVDVEAGDSAAAIAEMRGAGARVEIPKGRRAEG
jgi:nicotinamidase/pyrazinamidase